MKGYTIFRNGLFLGDHNIDSVFVFKLLYRKTKTTIDIQTVFTAYQGCFGSICHTTVTLLFVVEDLCQARSICSQDYTSVNPSLRI